MGSFSYICRGCGQPICQDEAVVLFHVRHGKELGRAVGIYYDYGRVEDDETFRGSEAKSPNTHREMCESEFELEDSGIESGISAWHQVCYKEGDLSISDNDPNQGWGKPQAKYKKINTDIQAYRNFTISIEQIKGAIVDIVAKDEKEAKQIAKNMLENGQVEPSNFIENKIKVIAKSATNIQKEDLIRELVRDFEDLSPNQIRNIAKEKGFDGGFIFEEVLERKNLL